MRLIKKLIFSILITITVVVALMAIPLFMFSKNYIVPKDQYKETEPLFMKQFDDEFVALLNDTDKEYVDISLTEVFINQFIKNQLFKENTIYQDENHKEELLYKYMYVSGEKGTIFAIKGVYTTLLEDQINVTLSIDVLKGNLRLYQTGVQLRLGIVEEAGTYTLQVKKIMIGKTGLPLKMGINITNFIMSKINGKTLDEVINGVIPVGEFNSKERTLSASYEELMAFFQQDAKGQGTLVELIIKNELLKLTVKENSVGFNLNLGTLRKLPTAKDKPVFTPLSNEAEHTLFMINFNSKLAAGYLANPSNPYVDLNEVETNQMVDYMLNDVAFSMEHMIKISETEKVKYTISSSNMFLTMEETNLSLHLAFMIEREGIINTFTIQMDLNTTASMVLDNLELEMIAATTGQISLSKEEVQSIFNIYSEGMFTDGKVIITKEQLGGLFLGANMSIKEVEVINGQFRIYYDLTL